MFRVTLSNQQFDRVRRLALALAGIELVERHRDLMERRSRRLGVCDDAGLESLLNAGERGETAATQRLLCLLTTKFTGFFRHPRHFELAARHALRAAGQRGRARLWSAGTATGEEAWSLAMAVSEAFQRSDPPVSVMATDVDVEALAFAARGEYGDSAMQAVDPGRRRRFFSCNHEAPEKPQRSAHFFSACDTVRASAATDARLSNRGLNPCDLPRLESWSVAPALRGLIEFQALNLVRSDWPREEPFDVIFCRNVLMYLEAGYRYAVLERMASLLAPGGLLLIDPTEHLGDARHWFKPSAEGVYSLRQESGKPPATTVRMYS